MESWGPVGALAVILALLETVKYLARRKNGGNVKNGFTKECNLLQQILDAVHEGNRRHELVLSRLSADRENAIRADERAKEFRRRMEEHMSKMECTKRE